MYSKTTGIAANPSRLFVTTTCYDPGVLALTRDELSEILGRLTPKGEPSLGGSGPDSLHFSRRGAVVAD